MYQPISPIIVIGSEGWDSLDHTFNYPLHQKCTTWQPTQTKDDVSPLPYAGYHWLTGIPNIDNSVYFF